MGKKLSKIDECTKALVEAIRESDEYSDYHAQLYELEQNPALYNRMNAFRRKNLMLQINTDDNFHGNFADLQMEFADILANPQVRNFLTAERKFGKILRRATNKIMESGDMDIDFLDEE